MATRVTLDEAIDADPRQAALMRRACGLLETALNHPEFAGLVAGASYEETRFEDAEGGTRSVPPDEVIRLIAAGAERGTQPDGKIGLRVKLDTLPAGVVGSTELGMLPFRTAIWFVDGCYEQGDVISLARHFIHEWLHVAGFYHYPDNKARGDVPYVIGDIVRGLLLRDKGLAENPRMARMLDEAGCGAAGRHA